jgi:hypothetical protein
MELFVAVPALLCSLFRITTVLTFRKTSFICFIIVVWWSSVIASVALLVVTLKDSTENTGRFLVVSTTSLHLLFEVGHAVQTILDLD